MTLFSPLRIAVYTLVAFATALSTTPAEAAEAPLGGFSCTVPQSAQSKFTDRLRRFSARNGFEIEVANSASGTTTIQIWRQELMAIADNTSAPGVFQVRIYAGSPQFKPANSMTQRVFHDLRRSVAEVADCRL